MRPARGDVAELAGGDGVEDPPGFEAVRGEQIGVAAELVDELVLQREGVEAAAGLHLPGELLGLGGEAAVRRLLLDDDHLAWSARPGPDALAVERLERVRRDDRHAAAGGGQPVGDLDRHLHDQAVGDHAGIAALAQVAQLAEHPRLDGLGGEIRLAGLADAQIDRPVLLRRRPTSPPRSRRDRRAR